MIRAKFEDEPNLQKQSAEKLFDSREEKEILERFCSYVLDKDPDIIVSTSDHFTESFRLFACKNSKAWFGSAPWEGESTDNVCPCKTSWSTVD
jgi:hypothetical protein